MPDLWTVAVTYEDHAHTHTDRHVTTDEVWDSIYDMMPARPTGPLTITITPEDWPVTDTPQNAPYGHDGTVTAPTAPPTLNGPQTATHDRWTDGYAAARHYYGDTAPIAVSAARELVAQFRDQWDKAGQLAGTPVGQLLDDLQAILDTATEPRQ